MQKLQRNQRGELEVVEVKDRSPIVTETHMPEAAKPIIMPDKSSMQSSMITEDELLEAMRKAGGKSLSTHQFATMITSCVKKKADPVGHHRWDLAHSHVRSLMRILEKQGKISMRKDPNKKKVRYIYDLK